MNFDFIKTLDGWTTPEKAQVIYDLVLKCKPKVAVEIGVFGGRGTVAIALALKSLGAGKVLAIDPWSAPDSAKAQIDPASEEWWGKVDHERVYKNFLWHLKRQGVEKFVEVRRESSEASTPPPEIGFLIVDGNHNEEALADAKKFAPNVTLGGYCLLDDLDWTGGYVRQAEEFIKSIGFAFIKLIDGQTGLYQRVEILDPAKAVVSTVEDRAIVEDKPRLTVALVTARRDPKMGWFLESLINQMEPTDKLDVIIVDFMNDRRSWKDNPDLLKLSSSNIRLRTAKPKPTIWQGEHKITKEDWWAMSNARNTAICLCETDWLACLDDRCVLMPGWLEAVKRAMAGHYAVCGSYQKRSQMVVEGGFIKGYDKLLGDDSRMKHSPNGLVNCPGGWMFGCNFALPLEWALNVNGFEEGCDGLSMEDVIFGMMLKNNGYQVNFDPAMRMIEDRTDGETASGHGVDRVMKRSDKGVSPKDKSHAALARFGRRRTTEFTLPLAAERESILLGKPWTVPIGGPGRKDWYDGQSICEL